MHGEPPSTNGGDDRGRAVEAGDAAPTYLTVPLADAHQHAHFRCKKSPRIEGFFINDWPKLKVLNYAKVFVYLEDRRVMGFYTLSAAAVSRRALENRDTRKPPAPLGIDAPMVRLGFLGRDDTTTKGLGGALINDAAERVSRLDIGVFGIVLDAESEELAAKVYGPLGFTRCKQDPSASSPRLTMYAPLTTLLPSV